MSGDSPIIMEDNLSIKSSDSVTTSGEYEIVPETPDEATKPAKSPTLNIANNGDFTDLEKNMHEVIHELDQSNDDAVNGECFISVSQIFTIDSWSGVLPIAVPYTPIMNMKATP